MADNEPDSSPPQSLPAPASPASGSNMPDSAAGDETFVLPMGISAALNNIYARFMANHMPFGFQARGEEIIYHPVPYRPDPGDPLLLAAPWRIELELYADEQRQVLGLDLHGDLILGRGASRPGRIILDLDPYGAHDLGVSREHLMLRPTRTRLFVLDQGSTNGTTVDGVTSGRGVATPLLDAAMLSLGNMVLMLRVIARPETAL